MGFRRRHQLGSLALTGVVGVVLAHVVGYVAIFPDGHERAMHLHDTGHGYWPLAVTAAGAAAGAVLLAAAWRGSLLGQRPRDNAGGTGLWVRLAGLAAWQLALFSTMESLERTRAGVSPAVLLHGREFAVGLILQVAVAWVALLVTWLVERVARRVVIALRRRPRRAYTAIRHVLGPQWLPRSIGWLLSQSRAPPTLLAR